MKTDGWYDRFIYRWHIDGRPVEKLSVGFAPEGRVHAGDILNRSDGSEQEVLRVEPRYKYINGEWREGIVQSVAGSMALSGMDLTEEDKERIRIIADDPEKVDEIVQQLIEKHKPKGSDCE